LSTRFVASTCMRAHARTHAHTHTHTRARARAHARTLEIYIGNKSV